MRIFRKKKITAFFSKWLIDRDKETTNGAAVDGPELEARVPVLAPLAILPRANTLRHASTKASNLLECRELPDAVAGHRATYNCSGRVAANRMNFRVNSTW